MTEKELHHKLHDLRSTTEYSLMSVAEYARTLVPLLRDKGLENVARELEAKLFVVDTQKDEVSKFMQAHLLEILGLVKGEKPE